MAGRGKTRRIAWDRKRTSCEREERWALSRSSRRRRDRLHTDHPRPYPTHRLCFPSHLRSIGRSVHCKGRKAVEGDAPAPRGIASIPPE
ncbi:hypothetical protein PMAYCL1PPCAC_02692 [Pristionchus mayeri]|uniref:Uncharacterized protein n=1 Tax=Pristionchus mayeri TaxID=1317129 RepID=A0AAN4Z0W1_9BILA|nr:hypothetical protein PMAYCL1PPCAC_02692 [Pristionchus mayeri]